MKESWAKMGHIMPLALYASAAGRVPLVVGKSPWTNVMMLPWKRAAVTTCSRGSSSSHNICYAFVVPSKHYTSASRCTTYLRTRTVSDGDSNPSPRCSHQEENPEHIDALVKAALAALPWRPRCAVIGGGFAGLATAYNLVTYGSDVTVFDPNEVGTGGASSVAAGLLHPLTPRGKIIWKGLEGLATAKELIQALFSHEMYTMRENQVHRAPETLPRMETPEDNCSTGCFRRSTYITPENIPTDKRYLAYLVANDALAWSEAERGGRSSACVTAEQVYRPLMDRKYDDMFIKAAEDLPEQVVRLTREEYLAAVPSAHPDCRGGVRIRRALVLDAQMYLKGLWAACRMAGARANNCESAGNRASDVEMKWVHKRVEDIYALAESGEFYAVVACVGPDAKILPGVKEIPSLRLVRGQSLIYDNVTPAHSGEEDAGKNRVGLDTYQQRDRTLLKSAVLCGEYAVPIGVNQDGRGNKLVCGSTREPISYADSRSVAPDMAQAMRLLGPKVAELCPALRGVEPLDVTSGVRVIQDRNEHGRIPIAGRLPFSTKAWVIAALGGRGLIHHAYLGRLVAACALLDSEEHLPPQVMAPLEGPSKSPAGNP